MCKYQLIFDILVFVGGKSAILTALCVAFGCRAKGTQRASTLKDFIKTGCRFVGFAFFQFFNFLATGFALCLRYDKATLSSSADCSWM